MTNRKKRLAKGIDSLEEQRLIHEEKRKTIILVTHDVEMVRYAHRVIYLKDGSVIKEEKRRKEIFEHGKDHHF